MTAEDAFSAVASKYGDRFDAEVLEATAGHWRARMEQPQAAHPPFIKDLAYGEHPRHRLDLFPVKGEGAPVVLFVHGGGFVAGDKHGAPPFYANVGRYFAAHGILGICMNYRLAPAHGWPAGAQDLEQAVQWILQRAEFYGGDASRLVVLGQSAGASHVATWLFHPDFGAGARNSVKAAILMSGFYQAKAPLSPPQRAYFGSDESAYRDRSPLAHARAMPQALLVTLAEHDQGYIRAHGHELTGALAAAGATASHLDFAGHNHVSPLMSLGSDNDAVGLQLRRFISQSTGGAHAEARSLH